MKHLATLLLLGCVWSLTGQRIGSISGMVTDSTDAPMPGASLVLMQPADSVMVSFASCDAAGNFTIKKVPNGDFLVQISTVGYETQYRNVSVTAEKPAVQLGHIRLQEQVATLGAAEVTAERVPMQIRNDTIVFAADAYKLEPGSTVEDLLKKLPTMQVDAAGNIRAQGEQVQKVLVDGKEFFGNDPTVATKNLPADAVDKVKVYDQKSERAEFTGISDGREERTINLELKEDKKHGYFGKADVAGGVRAPDNTADRYETKFNLNRFGKGTQLSLIGAANNTNQQAFSFDDYINFLGGLSNFMSGGGGGGRFRISLDANDLPIGGETPRGFTDLYGGGLNLNREFSPKWEINANYFANGIQNTTDKTLSRQTLLTEGGFDTDETDLRNSGNMGHRANFVLRGKPDTMQHLTFRGRVSWNKNDFESIAAALNSTKSDSTLNTSERTQTTDGTNLQGSAGLTYRRKLGKPGRSMVAEASYERGHILREGNVNNLYSSSTFTDAYQQRQDYSDQSNTYAASISYTEPLGKRQYLDITAAHNRSDNNTVRDVFNAVSPDEYIFNDQLSNRYNRNYQYSTGGLSYMRNRKKYNLTLTGNVQHSLLRGYIAGARDPIMREFVRVLPSAFVDFDMGMGRNLNFDYSTRLQEPSLEQLNPALNNADPLNLYIGNPNLRPEYVHEFGAHAMRFDQFTMTSIFANLRGSYTTDRITNASTYDSLLRRTFTPINTAYELTAEAYLGYNTPIRPLKITFNVNLNAGYGRNIVFINDAQNMADRWNNALELSFENRKKDKFDINVGARFSQNITRYDLNSELNQAFINQRYFADLTYRPNKQWSFTSGLNYRIYPATTFAPAQEVPLVRAGLTRYILKNRKGQIRLTAYDLLNRNVGITRNSRFNYLEQERVPTLGRYIMLTFAYSLSGFDKPQSGISIDVRGSED